MQILEIYIHTIIYIHIHTYTTSSTTTTTHHHPHHPHHRGEGGTDTFIYIYNFFHHHHHRHPPPPTPPTPQGGGGYTTTHHHPPPPTPPTPQGGGGYWGATIQTHNHGVGGGGRYLAMLAHIYIYTYKSIDNHRLGAQCVGDLHHRRFPHLSLRDRLALHLRIPWPLRAGWDTGWSPLKKAHTIRTHKLSFIFRAYKFISHMFSSLKTFTFSMGFWGSKVVTAFRKNAWAVV